MKNDFRVIILAGGKGVRMRCEGAKVLCEVGGRPMIGYLLDKVREVCARPVIVVGYRGEEVKKALGNGYDYVLQERQLGTGHAVRRAKSLLEDFGTEVVVLPGDHPLISAGNIMGLVEAHRASGDVVTLAVVRVLNFEGEFESFYRCGRILRDENGGVQRIVEFEDATNEEREIREVNVSYYCFDSNWLWNNIDNLGRNNKAGEYYVTDMVGLAVRQGLGVSDYVLSNPWEGLGVNTKEQLEVVGNKL